MEKIRDLNTDDQQVIEDYLKLFEEMMAEEKFDRSNYDAALVEDLYQALLEEVEGDDDVDYLVYQIGVLFGHLLARDHGYTWKHLTDEDGETLILISPKADEEPMFPFDVVYSLLEEEEGEEEAEPFFEDYIASLQA